MPEKEMGVVGLGTMGMNLARNLASHDARVAVYNRTHRRTEDFIAADGDEVGIVLGATFEELASVLEGSCVGLVRVYVGTAVDEALEEHEKVVDAGVINS